MAKTLRDVMTPGPVTLPATATVRDAALCMKEQDIGDILVMDGDAVCGIVTDRDIVIRAVADGGDPGRVKVGDICSRDLVTLEQTDPVEQAIKLMRDRAIRRMPVMDGGKPVGIVSIGDLAVENDPKSALADISAAPPND